MFLMLQKPENRIIQLLDENFPKTGIEQVSDDDMRSVVVRESKYVHLQIYPVAVQHPALLSALNEASVNFRRFLLNLIIKKSKREMYLAGSYKTEYGPSFHVDDHNR